MMSPILRAIRKAAKQFETKRHKDTFTWKFHVRIEEDKLDGGYVVECEEFPGCVSQGDTYDEAMSNIIDAIAGVVDARLRASFRELIDTDDTRPDALPVTLRDNKIAISV